MSLALIKANTFAPIWRRPHAARAHKHVASVAAIVAVVVAGVSAIASMLDYLSRSCAHQFTRSFHVQTEFEIMRNRCIRHRISRGFRMRFAALGVADSMRNAGGVKTIIHTDHTGAQDARTRSPLSPDCVSASQRDVAPNCHADRDEIHVCRPIPADILHASTGSGARIRRRWMPKVNTPSSAWQTHTQFMDITAFDT